MKLTQQTAPIAIGVGALLIVAMISVVVPRKSVDVATETPATVEATVDAPIEEAAPKPERIGGKSLPIQDEKIASGIDAAKIRIVMVGKKNCSIPNSKAICTEIPVYVNARYNADELVANIPNGRKVLIIESAGEWSHVAIFNVNGTQLTEKTGWTLTSWLSKVS